MHKIAVCTLKNMGNYREYSDEALCDATLVLQEVFMAKLVDHYPKANQKVLEMMAEEAGVALREHIRKYTGVDLHKVYK